MKMMPGMPKELRNTQIDDNEIVRVEAIIHSMTPKERRDTEIIYAPRRQRIAMGSGRNVTDVNALLKQFGDARKMMTSMMAGAPGKTGKNKKGKKQKGSRTTPKGTKAPQTGGGMGAFPGIPDFPGIDDM